MSYEHLADIFSKAYIDTKSFAAALEIVDRYRVQTIGAALADIVLGAAADLLRVPVGRLRTRDRHDEICRARWVAAWVLRGHGLKPRQIGRVLGLDRTTVLHGFKRVQETPDLLSAAEMVFRSVAVQDTEPVRTRGLPDEQSPEAALSVARSAAHQESGHG